MGNWEGQSRPGTSEDHPGVVPQREDGSAVRQAGPGSLASRGEFGPDRLSPGSEGCGSMLHGSGEDRLIKFLFPSEPHSTLLLSAASFLLSSPPHGPVHFPAHHAPCPCSLPTAFLHHVLLVYAVSPGLEPQGTPNA